MALKLITASSNYPVSLEEAKAHLNVDFNDDDELIDIYRKAATEEAERFTGQALIDQTWDMILDAFPVGAISIPKPPLIELVGLFYRDSAGVEQEFAGAGYILDQGSDREKARLTLAYGGTWPTPQAVANAVRLRFRTGYVDEDVSPVSGAVPYAIKAAILLGIGELYANRETVVIGQTVAMIPTAERLLRYYRVETAFA